MPGRTVFADLNSDGVLDESDPQSVTDSQGRYRLDPVPNNDKVYIRQLIPTGWITTGMVPHRQPNAFYELDVNLGSLDLLNTSLQGTAWVDRNADGNIDAGEPPMPGVTIYLDANDNHLLDTGESSRITDANGRYEFLGVSGGRVTVRQIVPSGYWQTLPTNVRQLSVWLAGLDSDYERIIGQIEL